MDYKRMTQQNLKGRLPLASKPVKLPTGKLKVKADNRPAKLKGC